jgi:UDP-4-amino-4,6-dideoxy-N-acetyl-beta-L-altrosamine N-acetyltransferase
MLRPLEETDLKLILLWRNALVVRQVMFTQHEISWDEHQAWFYRAQVDDSRQGFLFLDHENVPCAVVNFSSIDQVQKSAFWGFYANPDAKPGTGMRMSLDALDKAFVELGLRKLNAEVLASNQRSLEMHKKVGFIQEGYFRDHFFDGKKNVDVVRFGILHKEWPLAKQNLQDRINQYRMSVFEQRCWGNLSE